MILGIDGMPYSVTVEVSFADFTDPPVWEDITEYVGGFTIEQDPRSSGTLELTLDNADGRFTNVNSASPYYNQIHVNNQIRIRAQETSISAEKGLFLGYVDTWQRSWPGGLRDGIMVVTATDVCKFLNRQSVGGNIRAQENTGTRIDALTGGDTVIVGTDGYQVVAYTYTDDDGSTYDELQALAENCGGLFFIDGDGVLTYQTPYYRSTITTPDNTYVFGQDVLSFTGSNNHVEVDTDVFAPIIDDLYVWNTVVVTDGLGADHTSTDATSVNTIGVIEKRISTRLTAAAAATRATDLKISGAGAADVERVPQVTLDCLTSADCLAEDFRREISDLIQIKIHALGDTGTGWVDSHRIEGRVRTVGLMESPSWTVTFDLSPSIYNPSPP